MSNNAIEFDGVWKRFAKGESFDSLRDLVPSLTRKLFKTSGRTISKKKDFWALQDVSFQVGRGEALGIMGPNGSGKSTALKLLSRILVPNRGAVRAWGRMGALIELGAGFHPDLTGRENVFLNGTILGMRRTEIQKKFDDIVAFSGLSEFIDTPVKRYSSGMYARLGFSVAAHVDPEILLVDEVLSVGDYHFQEQCFQRMKEFVRNGTTVVFVSHNLTAISTLCKRALVLRYGVPVFHGDVSSAIQKYHSFYEKESAASELIEIVDSRLTSESGEERDVFEPGAKVLLEVRVRARAQLRDAHPGLQLHSADGQCLFVTASSRLTPRKLNLAAGESATIRFRLELNIQGGVFLLGFTVTPEVENPGEWLYYNPRLKRIVMTEERRCAGVLHLKPSIEWSIREAVGTEALGAGATR